MGFDGSKADMVGLPRLRGREPEDRGRVLAREGQKTDRQILQAGSCRLSPLTRYSRIVFWIISTDFVMELYKVILYGIILIAGTSARVDESDSLGNPRALCSATYQL